MLELRNITKKYMDGTHENIVVNNISLKIEEGEFISIIGQSGSGKSKLMHLIGGLDKPDSGEIIFNGVDISTLKDKEIARYRGDTIGFIFQDFNLDGAQTVLENVITPMIFARIPYKDREEKALSALDKVNMKNKAHNKVNELSGGQQQRVAIARALINNPTILLADEPTGNLDSKNGETIMKLLESLNRKGYTIIMVTHNMEQSYRADRILTLKDGAIIKETLNKKNQNLSTKKKK